MLDETQDPPIALRFNHNVIEHLGLKLYRNKPGNVLAELVANSWDAGAKNVNISFSETGESSSGSGWLSIADNGIGMPLSTIRDHYLHVGKPKRRRPTDTAELGRKPMGRKGLGKLAPFGISTAIQIVTVADGLVNWFRLDLAAIQALGEAGAYEPNFEATDEEMASVIDRIADGSESHASSFLNDVAASEVKSGTLIYLENVSEGDLPSAEAIAQELASRFTVVLLRDDFQVLVQAQPIDEAKALPAFELRIPEAGFSTEQVNGRGVRFWVGFVQSADWAADQAGVGVFAHGKIAQDRPYFFNSKGKEVFQRYMYAVVEADWIDEFDDDLIGTDRSTIDWSSPELQGLYEWGKVKVGSWLTAYEKSRREALNREIEKQADGLRESGEMSRYTQAENKQIQDLVAEATAQIGKAKTAENTRSDLLVAVSKAWVNQPTRGLLTDLWKRLQTGSSGPDEFTAILEGLRLHSVPEKMGLALTFANRAFAVTALSKYIHQQSEPDLQRLIAAFPWLLEPRADLLTADVQLKTTLEKLADEDGGTRYDASTSVSAIPADRRADFVFLSSSDLKNIRVAEIKRPGLPLARNALRQLTHYLDLLSDYRTSANVTGVLVGDVSAVEATDRRVELKHWDAIFAECRNIYVEMIAKMLELANVDDGDSRIGLIHDFGGEETWELLKKMAETDEDLKHLFDTFPNLN